MSPMILKLVPRPDWDNIKFVVDLANHRPISFEGCQLLHVTNVCESFKDEFKAEILRVGLSGILSRQRMDEALTGPRTTRNKIQELLIDFLQSIDTHGELVIVDPYFFAPSADPQYVLDVLTPFLSILTTLKIVTLPNQVDTTKKSTVISMISAQNSRLQIDCHTSTAFHDRFWLSDSRSQGIVTGTSLNGLGKRYALVDRLSSSDVKEIAKALQAEGI